MEEKAESIDTDHLSQPLCVWRLSLGGDGAWMRGKGLPKEDI